MNPLHNPHEIRHCEVCGTSLKGKRVSASTCSDRCRQHKSLKRKQTEAWAEARETPTTQMRPDAHVHTPPLQEPIEVQAEEVFVLPNYEAVKSGQMRAEDLPFHVRTLVAEIDQQKALLESKLKIIQDMNQKVQDLKINFDAERAHYKRLKFKQKQEQQAEKAEKRKEDKMDFFVFALHTITKPNAFALVVSDTSRELEQCTINLDKLKLYIVELIRQQNLLMKDVNTTRKELVKKQDYMWRIISRKDFLPNATHNPKTNSSPTMKMPNIVRTPAEPEPETTESYKPEPHKHTFSGAELRNMKKADIIQLPYNCNERLGDLTRQMCFIALSGNAGAGKTHFTFVLAHLFDKIGYKIKYFSLEAGISNQIIELGKNNELSKRFSISATGTAQDIREAAQNFDVVIIDSFGKAFKNAQEIDVLRQAYPETIFICIFQQTTEGTLRGGSAASYDCSAEWKIVFDQEKQTRTLHIVKSRYGKMGNAIDLTYTTNGKN